MKKSAESLSGWQIGALRMFAAGMVLVPFAVYHITKIPLKKLPVVFVSGLLGNFFPAFLFALAIEKISSSVEGILNSLTPLFVVIISVLFFKDKMPLRKILGVIIGFAGLLMLSLSRSTVSIESVNYMLLILLATFFYGLNVNVVAHYLKDVDPRHITTVSLALICLPAGIIAWQQNVFSIAAYDSAARFSVGAAVLLGVVGSGVATGLFYLLIQKAGGLFASMVTYAIPVVSIIWGLLDGEQVSLVQVASLLIILCGVYVANRQ